jgi:hypothetical protein
MKNFFENDAKLSMGRLLTFSLFIICTLMWVIIRFTKGELTNNDVTLIQWGWVSAIGGKAIQTFGERKK